MKTRNTSSGLALLLDLPLVFAAADARADDSLPGPFPVAQRNVTVTRPNGSTFTAQLRYPATSTSSTAPFHPDAKPAPAVSFGHGFLTSVSQYDSTLDHLASHGYAVIATTSEGSLFPNHANFALDIRYSLTHLESEDLAPASFLFGAIDETSFGVSGHSMGGGAAALAAAADVRIRCVATLAAAETNPSSAAAMQQVQRPIRLIVGSQDTIVPPSNTQPQYAACDAPRQFATIAGGSHCGFIDGSIIGCDSTVLPKPEQLAKSRALLLEYLDVQLRGEPAGFARVWGGAATVSGTTLERDPRLIASIADASLEGPLGAPLETSITVTNAGPDATEVVARVAPGALTVTFEPETTPTLAAGASATIAMRIASKAATTATLAVELVRVRDGAGRALEVSVTFAPAKQPADLDGNGAVDATDLAILLAAWGPCSCAADVDGSGEVDALDLATLLGSWT